MSKISIKKDFKNGDKLYDIDLNNNFRVIEAGVNANEENLEQVIENAEERLTNVFETESAATEARIRADNDETVQEIKDDNDETVEEIRQLTINEGWNWGGTTTDKVRFFKGNTSAVDSQPVQNGKLLFDEESGMIKLDDNNSRILLGGATWDETPKKPVKYKRKTTTQIASLPIEDGSVIYNTDNGKQFMDVGNQRIQTGGIAREVIIGDETEATEDTKLLVDTSGTTDTLKYKDNNAFTELQIKALDSMPVGTIVEFNGQASDIPVGWEQVNDPSKPTLLYSNETGTDIDFTLTDDISNYSFIEVFGYNSFTGNQVSSGKIKSNYSKVQVLLRDNYVQTGRGVSQAFCFKVLKFEGNNVNRILYNTWWTDSGSTEDDNIFVTEVIGFKY